MAMQIAIRTDIDQHVEAILAAAESAQQIVAAAAGLGGQVEHLHLARRAPVAHGFVDAAEGMPANGIKQRGGDFAERVVGLIRSTRRNSVASTRRFPARPGSEVTAGLSAVLIGLRVAGEGGRQRFAVVVIPNALGSLRAGLGDLETQFTHLGEFGNTQPADLFFERPNARHLTHIGGHAPEQEIPGDIECARGDVSSISLGLHRFGTR